LTSSANPIQRLSNPIQRLREHAEDYVNVIEHWKEAFKIVQNEKGAWSRGPFMEETRWSTGSISSILNNALVAKHNELARKWNYKILGGQPVGRPLAASETQIALRDAGTSLRDNAEETNSASTPCDHR
jgi:hypothetical protein